MPGCCDCNQNLDKGRFAKSQLKKSASARRCLDCAALIAQLVCHNKACATILSSNPTQCPGCESAKYCSEKCLESQKEEHREECPGAKRTRKVKVVPKPSLTMKKLGISDWKDFLITGGDEGNFFKCICCLTGDMTEANAAIHCDSKGHKAASVKKLYTSGKTFLQYDGTSWKCIICDTGPMTDVTLEKHLKQKSHQSNEKKWLKVPQE
jgi:hypothetical protein